VASSDDSSSSATSNNNNEVTKAKSFDNCDDAVANDDAAEQQPSDGVQVPRSIGLIGGVSFIVGTIIGRYISAAL
jgi:hypothetical protein